MINWSIYRANILLIYTFLLNLENLVLLWFGCFRISLLNCSSKSLKYDWYSLCLFPTVCTRQVALIYVEHYQFSALIDPNAYFTNTNGVPSAKLVVHPTKYICNQVQLISAESKARQGSSGTRNSRGTVASSMFAAVKNNFCWHKDWMAPRSKWERGQRDLRSLFVVCIIYAFDHIGTWKMSPQDAWAMMTSLQERKRGTDRRWLRWLGIANALVEVAFAKCGKLCMRCMSWEGGGRAGPESSIN